MHDVVQGSNAGAMCSDVGGPAGGELGSNAGSGSQVQQGSVIAAEGFLR